MPEPQDVSAAGAASEPRAFISHSGMDRARFVDEFARKLRAKGIDAWLAGWELTPGDSLVRKIFDEGLKDPEAVVVVLSKSSVESKWVREELDAAMIRKIEGRTRLIPVKIEECKVPEALLHIFWVDAAKLGLDGAVDEVVGAIHGHTKRPALGSAPSYTKNTISIGGLTDVDVTFLRLAYEQAVATDSTQVDMGWMIEAMGREGVGEQQVRDAADILDSSGYIHASKALGAGIIAVRIENYGISTLLSASMPEYEDLKKQSIFLLVNEKVHRAEVLAERLGQPAIFANHILEEFESQGYVKLSGEIGRYRRVAWPEAPLRRVAAQLGG